MDATEIIIMTVVMVGGTLLLLAIILALMSAVTSGVLGRVGRRSREAAQQQYPNARLIDAAVSFWGQQSRGVGQVRGNGTLIVTNDAVIFQMWGPIQEYRIPMNAIQSIENPRAFLGKTQGVLLLKINFLNDSGQPDAMAWRLRDLSRVQQVIEEARA